ncbi:Dolichyl-phosphate-mannose-protein mannosyltransferase [Paenibacillus sp. 1_12]|uniref:glycosyltransferase family 39 protein n=1 Tax=Paenibacillus sp. 1_12 TaxID=1566278 RepID=UPI0008DF2988|nr:glycosyltransferase family 39 protein [Paenibacillus sp. 1_12]SFM23219.1 Dolichyl-phosphate-mannose-protein mannosyltransferase [Paenibacillus sp. 1_12]
MSQLHYIYHKYKHVDLIYILPLALLSLWVRLRYFFYLLSSGKGFPQSDDTQWYLDYAYSLMEHFKVGLDMNDILYIGYNVLLTVMLAVFKDPVAVIFIQAVTAALSVILVYKISQMIFNRTTAIIASLFYAYSWDITLWSVYILTDSFFISLQLLSVYCLLKMYASNKNVYKIIFIATALYMLVFRPAGIITVSFVMIYVLINLNKQTIMGFVRKYGLILGSVFLAAVLVAMVVFTGNKLDPLMVSLQFNAKKVLYNIYATGWLFDRASPFDHKYRPNYTIDIGNSLIISFIVHNWDNILILYGKRIVALLGRWVFYVDLTTVRGIVKFAWNAFPVVMFLTGLFYTIRNGLSRKASILWLTILASCVFCVIFFIDGMYRYRAPGLPFIAIVAAYGGDRIIKGAIVVTKKYVGKLLWNKQKYSL